MGFADRLFGRTNEKENVEIVEKVEEVVEVKVEPEPKPKPINPADIKKFKTIDGERVRVNETEFAPSKGRPIGTGGKYTMTDKALKQRRVVNLKHGMQSAHLRNLVGNCNNCMIGDLCKKRETLPKVIQDFKGCDDIHHYFLEKLKSVGSPVAYTMKKIAELDMIWDIQQMRDSQKGMTPQFAKVVELTNNMLNTLHKMKIDISRIGDRRDMNMESLEETEMIDVSAVHKQENGTDTEPQN